LIEGGNLLLATRGWRSGTASATTSLLREIDIVILGAAGLGGIGNAIAVAVLAGYGRGFIAGRAAAVSALAIRTG